MYSNAKYLTELCDQPDGKKIVKTVAINVDINGSKYLVPLDYSNTDYANIMKLVEEGKLVIAPAEETE
jgi:hypothetical protein